MPNKKFKVALTLKAQSDLREIATWHKFNVGLNSVKKITTTLLDKIGLLGEFPEIGAKPAMAQIADSGFRYIVVRDYLCFYTVEENTVFVHHIVHGSTDYIQRIFGFGSCTK